MKKVFFFLLAVSSCTMSIAQDTGKIESLDSFFAGIPLRERYEKWVLHLATHFGIDSTNERGLYSSFKPDTKSHFPFPDSVQVKILLYTAVNTQTSGSIPVDTVRSILIEGVFGSSKNAKKDAYSYFNELKSVLRIHYKKNTSYSEDTVDFFESINRNFPDIHLERGYFKEQDFYYVLLMCHFDYWTNY